MKLSFDIGGTFTDFVLEDEATGRRRHAKILSTPVDPSVAVLAGVRALLGAEAGSAQRLETVLHATTVATNAILERKGAPTALITTRGFRDVLLLGRQKRYETFDLRLHKPLPLLRRRDIFEVDERVLADGTIDRPLDLEGLAAVLDRIAAGGYCAVAVCLLHAYAAPAHEQRIAAAIAARGRAVEVSLSSVVSPKFREYERTSTTVADAYVKPAVGRYVSLLDAGLRGEGVAAPLFIMQSNGGLVTPALACAAPIRIVESGPAAGVLMCRDVARRTGRSRILSFDMGGTTAKLGAIDDGEPAILPGFEVDQRNYRPGSGLPLNIAAIEMLEIGAGGGSIARIARGLIQIGPESAGAAPGPVCYGRGGTEPAVTDANLVLGYLDPGTFNGGAMVLDRAAAAQAIDVAIAAPLGIDVMAAAWGIHAMANAHMERAMRIVSVERGRDPREYALVAFGGAGPLHAARLAAALGIREVVIPAGAGVGSALGLLRADRRLDYSVTRLVRLATADDATVAAIYARLLAGAAADIARLFGDQPRIIHRHAYVRFAGQGYEVAVDLPSDVAADAWLATLSARFHAAYRKVYGFAPAGQALEGVDWAISITAPQTAAHVTSAHMPAAHVPTQSSTSTARPAGERPAYFPAAGGLVRCAVVARAALVAGQAVAGPAVIEEADCTTVVPPGCTAVRHADGDLVLTVAQEG